MLTVLTAGLPISAKDILNSAMSEVFEGTVTTQELTKENLRSRVRLSSRSVEVILVILDGVSSDLCKDIEGGLYKSDKYYEYVNDKELVNFLNLKYGLNMEIDTDIEEVSSGLEKTPNSIEDSDIERYYLDKLKIKEDIILNLECRIKELTSLYCEVEDEITSVSLDEDIQNIRDENISLNNDILDLKSKNEKLSADKAELNSKLENLEVVKKDLENRINRLIKNYDDVVSELNELKVTYTKQSGVIRDKDFRISELEGDLAKTAQLKEELSALKGSLSECRNSNISKDAEIANLRVDLESKDRDIVRYLKEVESLRGLEGASEELVVLKDELKNISASNDDLKKRGKEKDRVISQLTESNEDLTGRLTEEVEKNEELLSRIKDDDKSLALLNKEKLELQSRISLLEKSQDSNNDTESLLKEIQDLQDRLASVSSNIFMKIGSSALPNGAVGARVLKGQGKFNNIRFAFAGSADSRKGAYRCLLDEFRSSTDGTRYLIVDLVSETSVDYVFEIKKVVSGIEWFRKGGSVQQYVSNTALRNTQVLSVGLGYINDSYFLCIDWAKRLLELDNSGYKVVLFCGDLSNLVGRVLHESFASYSDSVIYVVGNAVGSRSIVTNLRGISNASDSVVAYYEFNPAMERFYDIVSKTNDCRILSTKGNYRK